jgi:hypothetical protein
MFQSHPQVSTIISAFHTQGFKELFLTPHLINFHISISFRKWRTQTMKCFNTLPTLLTYSIFWTSTFSFEVQKGHPAHRIVRKKRKGCNKQKILTFFWHIELTTVMSSQIRNAPNVASSWLSWISILITWTEELSVGVRPSKAVNEE